MKKITFKILTNNINLKTLNKLIKILKKENKNSILANLSNKNIISYLHVVINSKNLKLFVILKKGIIGYALIARQPKYLINEFEKFKFPFLIDLVSRFRLTILFNIIVSKLNLDTLFKNKAYRRIFNGSLNLNLLGVEKKYQSKGIGQKFLKFIFKKSRYKSKYITCETENLRSKNFYQKKLKFRPIGKKIRFPKYMEILAKKLR